MSKKKYAEIVAWLILFGPLPFLFFYIFIFAIYYYIKAMEIPFFLVLPFVWFCCLRVFAYIPKETRMLAHIFFTPFVRKNPISINAIFEAAFWYALITCAYLMLHKWFGFTKKSAECLSIKSTLSCYFAFFVGSIIGTALIVIITKGLRGVWRELATMRFLILRLISTFVMHLTVILFFAGIYRFLDFHSKESFNKTLISSMDSIYFSTVTITTLGYGDISPQSQLARATAAVEALVGVYLMAVLIGLVISLSIEERNKHNNSNSR